ncbi:MAG: hypothetical protein ABIP41_00255 [Croceibacterium sp.]
MADEDQARGRFMMIQMVRITGVAMVLVGMLILRGRIHADHIAGYVLLAAGLVDVFLVPFVLARRWRTPPA